ncbi:MAG: biopolymer transporter ExbD [Candidatus Eremiobacteraeota bacterium]|nr:biopolymer transporter ExbD [Candidatus Eremiobacteraeota bacterium]
MRRFARPRKKKSPRIEIIPMVDVMFLLLVFYVLSSLAMSQNKGIQVALPAASTGQASAVPQMVVVTVDSQGQVFLLQEKVEVSELAAKVQELAASRSGGLEALQKDGIVLNADQTSQMKQTVAVMDQLRQVGVYNFSISTQDGAKP